MVLRKYAVIMLAGLMLNLFLFSSGVSASSKEMKRAAKVKTAVTKLGVGRDARISVKLNDGKKAKGYVSEIRDSSFVVTDLSTGAATEVPYNNAKQVKGNNLSNGAKIAIGVAIFLAFCLALGLFTDVV